MPNPYSDLPKRSFWRTAISEKSIFSLDGLYVRKFEISRTDRIGAAGSCFAQHVSANMRRRGFNIIDVEPAPSFLSREKAREQGYGIYSARYGNIYTVRQMLQLIDDANLAKVRDEDFLEMDGRFIDLLRPNTEPNGYESLEEAKFNRLDHLERVKELYSGIDLCVFTLGLTEAWRNKRSGTVYPVCPDTLNDTMSGAYEFCNFGFEDIIADLKTLRLKLQSMSPGLRFLFTVSPVPLTATASNQHVLVATTYSKSTLRAVCGTMEQSFSDVDYFPSYEVITASLSRGVFYEPNMRNVNTTGVNTAMSLFFAEHDREPAPTKTAGVAVSASAEDAEEEAVCEEKLLEAFAR